MYNEKLHVYVHVCSNLSDHSSVQRYTYSLIQRDVALGWGGEELGVEVEAANRMPSIG